MTSRDTPGTGLYARQLEDAVDDSSPFSVLSDISSSMFAAFLLFFFVIISHGATLRPAGPEGSSNSSETWRSQALERKPLTPSQSLEMLFKRARREGVSMDLKRSSLVVVMTDRQIRIPADRLTANATLYELLSLGGGSVRLYVFSNVLYNRLITALRATRQPFNELSVPAALRNRKGTYWSRDFLGLHSSASNLPAFTQALAKLLEAQTSRTSNNFSGASAFPHALSIFEPQMYDKIRLFLRLVLNLIMSAILIISVFFIEKKAKRSS